MKLNLDILTLYSCTSIDQHLQCYLDSRYLGACPGKGAFHLSGKNSYMGAYPGVGTCLGYYSII